MYCLKAVANVCNLTMTNLDLKKSPLFIPYNTVFLWFQPLPKITLESPTSEGEVSDGGGGILAEGMGSP